MIVLPFGVWKFLSGIDAAHAEMLDAHYLYNRLVTIERWKRREYAAIRSRYVPGLSEVEAAYEQLSEWIGEHAGKGGERGKIREKRQRASAPKKKGAKPRPTKRVDDVVEIDTIAEMKRWRKAAGELAKPLRDQFEALIREPSLTYEARTCGVPREWLDERETLKQDAKQNAKQLAAVIARIEDASPKTHKKGAANERVLAEMLNEPWHDAWKDSARHEATAHALKQWVSSAHHLNHGTYTAVADDVMRAGKRPKPRPDGEPRRPRRRPTYSSKERRKIGWQLQGHVTWGDLCAGRFRDVIVSNIRPAGKRKNHWLATVRIRITTEERGAAEWVAVEIVQHRPVPDDTRISWVYLVPKARPGDRWSYSVQFTAEPTEPLIQRALGKGHVHVDLCWTQVDSTLIVARINGAPLELPRGRPGNPAAESRRGQRGNPGIVERLKCAERLQGYADQHFDVARAEVVKRLQDLPADVQAACAGIPKWRSHHRLTHVAKMLVERLPKGLALGVWRKWRDNRLGGRRRDLFVSLNEYFTWAHKAGIVDGVFALWLDAWRRKDLHLEQMADGTRRDATNWRRDFYRSTAARLAEQYETCSLGGGVDLEALALRDKSEDRPPKELHQAARHNRQLAAVSELKEAIKYAFGKDRMCEQPGDAPDPESARSSSDDAESVASGHAAE